MLEYQDGGHGDALKVHRRAGSSSMGQANSSASLASIADGPVVEAASPEAESYVYIETVLEALAVLGRLGGALERVTQRVSSEIHTLIEATLDEVEERVEQRRSEAQDEPFAMRISNSLEVGGPPQHAAILRDLFWTLYSKLAAVLEGHRIVYEVARWISSVSRPRSRAHAASRLSRLYNQRVGESQYTGARDLQAVAECRTNTITIVPH